MIILLLISSCAFSTNNQWLKDHATKQLYKATLMNMYDCGIHKKRDAIMYALEAGADVTEVQKKFKPLLCDPLMETAMRSQDEILLKQLLDCGANVHVKWYGFPILLMASKVSVAQLLMKHKVHDCLTHQEKYDIFSTVMQRAYEPTLIDLYKNHNFDPMMRCERSGWTLLMELARSPQQVMIQKAQSLIHDLTPEQIKKLIETKSNLNRTVFDIIAIKKERCTSKKNRASLDTLHTFLSEQLHNAVQAVQVEQATEQLRNAVLMDTCEFCIQRAEIVHALKAGADVHAVQAQFAIENDPLLTRVLLFQDEKLVELLLNQNVDVNRRSYGDSVLVFAEKCSIAKLLLEHGAHNHLTNQEKYRVFASAMNDYYESGLVDLYKKYGFDPMGCCEWSGCTLLMKLASCPQQAMMQKAQSLIKDLSSEQIKNLIEARNKQNETVFDIIIATSKSNSECNEYCASLESLHTLLSEACKLVQVEQATEQLYKAVYMGTVIYDIDTKYKMIMYALKAGADVKAVQARLNTAEATLVEVALRLQDTKLLELLFDCGVDVQVQWCGLPILHLAKKGAIAKLLLEHGAHKYLTDQKKYRVFASAMEGKRESELISLYKEHGFNPMSCCEVSGWTLFMELASYPQQAMMQKAELLVKDLTSEQIRKLVVITNNKQETVFDIIASEKLNAGEDVCAWLDEYRMFLVEQLKVL